MRHLKALLILTLALAVLPWGAWAGLPPRIAAARALAGAPIGAQAAPPALDRRIPAAEILAAPARRCHGPALPGAPCGADHALAPAALSPPVPPETRRLRPPPEDLRRAGRVPAGMLDPPRSR